MFIHIYICIYVHYEHAYIYIYTVYMQIILAYFYPFLHSYSHKSPMPKPIQPAAAGFVPLWSCVQTPPSGALLPGTRGWNPWCFYSAVTPKWMSLVRHGNLRSETHGIFIYPKCCYGCSKSAQKRQHLSTSVVNIWSKDWPCCSVEMDSDTGLENQHLETGR